MEKSKPRIPVNLIAGPLGVGKTTAINHLLASRPAHEKWAVLINEYGLIGLDAALLQGEAQAKDVDVREVAGGCICCSASFMFDVSLVLMLQRRPDRLIIEPTGLATLSGILDTLARPGISESVDVRSVVCLLDPASLTEDFEREEVKDQVDAADVLLANRADVTTPEDRTKFDVWAKDIFPPKDFIGHIEQGQIPPVILDLVSDRAATQTRAAPVDGNHHLHAHSTPEHAHDTHEHGHEGHDHHGHGHEHGHEGHDHHGHGHEGHDHASLQSDASSTELKCDASTPIVRRDHRSATASSVGWACWRELFFDFERTTGWLKTLADRPGVRRVKAVLHTDGGWWSINLARGVEEKRSTGYRRDSRLELVIESDAHPDVLALERELHECILDEPPKLTSVREWAR